MRHFRAQGVDLPQNIADFFDLLHHLNVIPLHHPLSGIIEGTKHLARLMPLDYYTVRKHTDAGHQQAIEERTKQRLGRYGFPNPHTVVFCKSRLDKLVQLVEREGARMVYDQGYSNARNICGQSMPEHARGWPASCSYTII